MGHENVTDLSIGTLARILLVVGGNDVPGSVSRACRVEAFLIGLHVLLPEFSLGNVPGAEFPVLFRFVDARQEALSPFLVGEVEEELDDAGSVLMKVPLQIRNRAAVVPDLLLVVRCVGNPSLLRMSGCTRRITLPRISIG
jgi:hypothetical protein